MARLNGSEPVRDETLDLASRMLEIARKIVEELESAETVEHEVDGLQALDEARDLARQLLQEKEDA